MPSWSSKWSFFLIVGFLIYTISGGYGSAWKAIFTRSVASGSGNSPTGSNATGGGLAPLATLPGLGSGLTSQSPYNGLNSMTVAPSPFTAANTMVITP